jgi:hypothetical protein
MRDDHHKIRIQDLTGIAPWLEQHDIEVDLEREPSGRVVGFVSATAEVYQLMAEYQAGPTVQLLDFLAVQRRMRGRLLDLRNSSGKNGYRKNGSAGARHGEGCN